MTIIKLCPQFVCFDFLSFSAREGSVVDEWDGGTRMLLGWFITLVVVLYNNSYILTHRSVNIK